MVAVLPAGSGICFQLFYKTFGQGGIRFLISAYLGIAFVAEFALHFSLAGGVMFVYAAILMYVEPRIAHRKSQLDPRGRLRLVYLASHRLCFLSILSVIYDRYFSN